MTNNLARFALLAVPAFLLGQTSVPQKSEPSDKDTRPYDKHDFNGIWARNPSAQFHQPPCPECRDNSRPSYGFFGDIPPLTAEGKKRFDAKSLPT